MKRHANTLLQRKRAEFEGADDRGLPHEDNKGMSVVEVKDGYDWLRVIKQVARDHRAPAG
ncbi:MAG TPA: hypothetical protein VGC19_07035 [Rhodanobacter sp.]